MNILSTVIMDKNKEGNGSSPPPPPPPIDLKPSYTHALLEYISVMLMEEEQDEELGNNPFHDVSALQATEKSLHDALHNINLDSESPIGSKQVVSESSGAKKTRSREDSCDLSEHQRSNKQLAANKNAADDESELLEMYEDVLLLGSKMDSTVQTYGQSKEESRRRHGYRNKNIIDLRSLLMQCAQAVENSDNGTLLDLLCQTRQHSSPEGDDMERLAHYFASAIESRLSGTGTHTLLNSYRISAAEILRAYKMYVIACPFKQMSNIMANWTINDLTIARRATTIHIVDFGILYGLQWPCLIHALSERSGQPLFFRITAIDFPQPGFRPAERVVDTCRRLEKWARRFGVPFEYSVIAQRWDTIRLEDLKIEKKEALVVNCMYRLHNVPDESETGDSPRDAVLDLIKRINPDLFVHGVCNGTHNTPFFVPRFKEALFHFATMFNMFEATVPKDDEDRLLYEKQILGKEIMNIIACEGTERVERPEKYKLWQTRTVRAGFKQVRIDQRIVEKLKKVRTGYHKSFSVDEEGKWVLLGWKGRIVQGFSCWRPIQNRSSS